MNPPAAPLTLDDQLCFALYSASIAVGRLYKPLLDQLGITYPQYLVLSTLWEQDGLTIGGIAERLALEPSTITPLVKRLESAGLLRRARNPVDEREVHARLTPSGLAIREKSACLGMALFGAANLTIERLHQLTADVRAMRDAVANETGRPPMVTA